MKEANEYTKKLTIKNNENGAMRIRLKNGQSFSLHEIEDIYS
jgi:hypothetical protein